jgi:hypothetical protein
VSTPAPRHTSDEEPEVDPEQFLRNFRRRMAEKGLIMRMATAGPDWEPPVTLDIPGDELSAMVVRLRRGGP